MTALERALYEAGAHIAFKEVDLSDLSAPLLPQKLKKWKVPKPPGKTASQRMVGGIPRSPIDKNARVVTSRANWIHKHAST